MYNLLKISVQHLSEISVVKLNAGELFILFNFNIKFITYMYNDSIYMTTYNLMRKRHFLAFRCY